MTRRELTALTVPQLRDLARDRGLPVYQHRGRRLKKADLVAQLVKRNGRNVKRRPGILKPEPRTLNPLVQALADEVIRNVIASELPPDPDYSRAMRRVLRGSTARRDLRVLDRRRRAAIAMLADRGPDVLRPYWRGLLAALPAR